MSYLGIHRLLDFLTSIELLMAMLWIGLAVFTVGLAILVYSRWGQYKPLRKCMAMSLFAHLLLAGYAATIQFAPQIFTPEEKIVVLSLGEGEGEGIGDGVGEGIESDDDVAAEDATAETPTESMPVSDSATPDPITNPLRSEDAATSLAESVETVEPTKTLADDALASLGDPFEEAPRARLRQVSLPSTIHVNAAERAAVPNPYRLRVAPNRIDVVKSHGGSASTEGAVNTALRWLAENQSADGRWDPRVHGAGVDNGVLGRNRQNAGSRADCAVTGLALLAFLGAGHTHLDGPYQNEVRRGLEFLMQSQAADGNLAGHAVAFEFMYCHAMASFAMSEAYGMTHDRRLHEPVRRAIGYTIAAQDPVGGGWRYRPNDPGDTSQLGWQLMALKSAELAGIPIPNNTRQGIMRFLQSVSSGKAGGRASYRPGERATRSMTAEALVCWQFLGLAREHPACNEAGDFILEEVPGEGQFNLYYWYYATLGTYQLQDAHWERWNEAMQTELVRRQVKAGPLAGSWDTDDLWGGHGGRVYTTAIATLTLEVYYRFLPLYGVVARAEKQVN